MLYAVRIQVIDRELRGLYLRTAGYLKQGRIVRKAAARWYSSPSAARSAGHAFCSTNRPEYKGDTYVWSLVSTGRSK